MLDGALSKELFEAAIRGRLADPQTDDLVFQAWARQEGHCPCCRESMDWAKGVAYVAESVTTWVCMICAILEIESRVDSDRAPVLGKDNPCKRVPIPPGYELVYASKNWMPELPDGGDWSDVMAARAIGVRNARRFWAAAIEEPKIARRTLPRSGREGFLQLLLPKSPFHEFQRLNLYLYMLSEEAQATTQGIHSAIAYRENPKNEVAKFKYMGIEGEIEVLNPELISSLPEMNFKERRKWIPRIGVIDLSLWEKISDPKRDSLPTICFTLVENSLVLYMIPLYGARKFYGLSMDDDAFFDQVGFDYASDLKMIGLWESVFGSI